ncbi:4,4'-diaponeurosporenoate glycosyltransferase [Polystyrenella longa]|uniref:4,4'-diaponeurosporenoate glycosyltransferase n=1 Tax=Polystyrenella longa TaxID=2528007 RepID=A0A518CGP6_9PLAN|nr:glycosyltransferase [Polystyrenella longa]QDU78398.1 4,4'-diaponeurosporenoate glycosyltransferase [Polystyrenella longa]
MTAWQLSLLGVYGFLILITLSRHFVCSYQQRFLRVLKLSDAQVAPNRAPLVSILVPAKDEADKIAACLDSLCNLNYPAYEVLVIDDRSDDNTAEIVRGYGEEYSHLRLIQIEDLPAGWTGKTHALQYGQKFARGEWLLFVDADTTHHPDTLSITLHDAIEHELDMLTALPTLKCHSFWEKVIQPYASTCLIILFPLSKANNHTDRDGAWGNGQFILINRKAYDEIGQHRSVRDKFVEDIALARRVRQQGLRLNIVSAAQLFSVRMYSSFEEITRGWSRIFYSATDCKPGKLFALMIFIGLFSITPYAFIMAGGLALWQGTATPLMATLFYMGVVHELVQLSLYARIYPQTRTKRRYLAFRLVAVLTMCYVLAKTIRMCFTHEVNWRGTVYGLDLQQNVALETGQGSIAAEQDEDRIHHAA